MKRILKKANMTEVAIRRLETSEEGYYLFIEGGRIDLAHHASEAIR
jgi:alkaline phosphatase